MMCERCASTVRTEMKRFAATARSDFAGQTWEGVREVTDEIEASVIVVGSHGVTGMRELVEGSVSHEIAQHSPRPVLVVPPLRRH
jgi:nucleotide-binding universal stress UspA family protein